MLFNYNKLDFFSEGAESVPTDIDPGANSVSNRDQRPSLPSNPSPLIRFGTRKGPRVSVTPILSVLSTAIRRLSGRIRRDMSG